MDSSRSKLTSNPCKDCQKSTKNGIDCDKCSSWYCLNCINAFCADTVTADLYRLLNTLASFPWNCHHCCNVPLGTQLINSGVTDRKTLLTMSVNPRSLPKEIGATTTAMDVKPNTSVVQSGLQTNLSPPTATTAASTEMLLKQVLDQQAQQQQILQTLVRSMMTMNIYGTHQQPSQPGGAASAGLVYQSSTPAASGGFASAASAAPADLVYQQHTPTTNGVIVSAASTGLANQPLVPASNGIQSFTASAGFVRQPTPLVTFGGPVHTTSAPILSHLGTAQMSTTMSTVNPMIGTPGFVPASIASGGFQGGSQGGLPSSSIEQSGAFSSHYSNYNPYFTTPVSNSIGLNTGAGQLQMPYNVPLPKIKLPEFFGDLEYFDAWWESYAANVHSRPIPEKLKWDYLQQTVKGNAAKKIEGLGYSSANYNQAIAVLHSVYGRSELLRPNVWAALNNLAPIKPNLRNLEEFTDAVRSKTTTLKRLGVSQDTLDEYTTHLLDKLPPVLHNEIQKMRIFMDNIQPGYSKGRWTMDKFLETLIQFQFMAPTPNGGKEKLKEFVNEAAGVATAANLIHSGKTVSKLNGRNKGRTCIYCDGRHFSDKCRNVPTHQERKEIINSQNRCLRCLSTEHKAKECTRSKECYYCGKDNHHCSLCYEGQKVETKVVSKVKGAPKPQVEQKLLRTETTEEAPAQSDVSKNLQCIQPVESDNTVGEVIMPTIPGFLVNAVTGAKVKVLACLDTGCTNTNLRQEIADQLQLSPIGYYNSTTARYGDAKLQRTSGQRVEFIFQGSTQYAIKMQAATVSNLCPPFPVEPIKLTKEIAKLLDTYNVVNKPPSVQKMQQIDMLIGGEYYNTIMHATTSSVICLQGSLRIHLTPFGGILSGCAGVSTTVSKKKHKAITHALMCMTKEHVQKIETHDSLGIKPPTVQMTPTVWNLDSVGIKDTNIETSVTEFFDTFFKSTTVQLDDGRYEVRFPFKSQYPVISDNLNVAIKRLASTVKKLSPHGGETELLCQYNGILEEYLHTGKIEHVSKDDVDGSVVHYLTHFPVIKESSATTKVRIVLDPSLKTRQGTCLNDLLYTRSNLMEDLTGLLLRFRLPKFALTADIQAAFLAVSLAKPDRDAIRVLWLKDPTKTSLKDNVKILRFCRIPFGTCASPWLLNATLKLHLERHQHPIAKKFNRQIYMDNAILMAETATECFEIYQNSKMIFQEAQMNLREWHSNCPSFQEKIPSADRASGTVIKVLGLQWNTKGDTFSLTGQNLDQMGKNVPTKRQILQNVAKTWDPLGLCNPVIISGRLLLQQMWIEQFSWDAPASDEIAALWEQTWNELQKLPQIKFQRRVLQSMGAPIQLLCFTDASPVAYATAIYLKQDGHQPHLVFSKARVAPIKPQMTLPRLELLGILIGCRAMKFVESQLELKVEKKVLWSDSQIALHQILTKSLNQPWIQRRVDEINRTKELELQYVLTTENPADKATKGVTVAEMISSTWLSGPEWLADNSSSWPFWALQSKTVEGPPEVPAVISSLLQKAVPDKALHTPFSINLEKFSSLRKLLAVTAYSQRFINRIKGNKNPHPFFTTEELRNAELLWIKYLQEKVYSATFKMLKQGKLDQLARQLDLFLDPDDVIRCGGRVANAPIAQDARFPVLLPKNGFFTMLIVMDFHHRNYHFKVKHTLSQIRTKYWIPCGITVVRKILQGCIICRKVEGKPFQPPKMGQLPVERLSQARVFQYCALDYLGPLSIKAPGKEATYEKRWIAVFTCFVVRAVHLELISDCSTEAAVRAIERFVARRGLPTVLMSDNQSSFIAAAKTLQEIWKNQAVPDEDSALHSYFSKEGIRWDFIPQRSPWVNGITERLVSLVKRALRKTLWRACVTEENLNTLLIKIEGVLNSRPLLTTSSKLNDGEMLTPSHFILGSHESPTGFPPVQDTKDPEYMPHGHVHKDLIHTWTKTQKRLDSFWKVFQTQYLQELREQHKYRFQAKPGEVRRLPTVGETCLVQEPGPRLQWPLVRIKKLLPSSQDGEIRFVEVELPSGTITKRGVKDLIPLEITPDETSTARAEETTSITDDKPSATPEATHRMTTRSIKNTKVNNRLLMLSVFLMLAFLPSAMCLLLVPIHHPLHYCRYSQSCLPPAPAPAKLFCPQLLKAVKLIGVERRPPSVVFCNTFNPTVFRGNKKGVGGMVGQVFTSAGGELGGPSQEIRRNWKFRHLKRLD